MPAAPTVEELLATVQDAEKLLTDLAGLLPSQAQALQEAVALLQSLQNNPLVLELLLAGIGLLKSRPSSLRR